jgi:peptidoglycan/xylan/chitin deacetylase (PgdA/CDA1 family)
VPRDYRPPARPTAAQYRRRRLTVLAVAMSLTAAVAAWLGRPGPPPLPLGLSWVLSPAANTVTLHVTAPAGAAGLQLLARSRVAVTEHGTGAAAGHWSAAGAAVTVPVPAGAQVSLLVQVTGPQQLTRTVTVATPAAPQITSSGASDGRWLMYTSVPLQAGPAQVLCGTETVAIVAATQLAVTEGATACTGSLRLTAQDGEQATVPVTIPARVQLTAKTVPSAALYCFGSSAGRAVYITIDDGWTPSAEVLDLMHQTYLPITAFLIADAAKENLGYWREFTAAGGLIGDHTVSHPYLTKLTLAAATAQWGQDRTDLDRWLGQTPAIGRPPYGAFNATVEKAAASGGLTALAGWSATMSGDSVQTWDSKPLSPGEIVILHWDPGLGAQLTALLAVIRTQHLNPEPLTAASFTGIAPQHRTLSGD